MTTETAKTAKTANATEAYHIGGSFSLQDIKYDLLKIIEPFDGYMYNGKDTTRVRGLFEAYLFDLKRCHKLQEYSIFSNVKDNAVTFDVSVKIQRDRSAKKLKIHVGALQSAQK